MVALRLRWRRLFAVRRAPGRTAAGRPRRQRVLRSLPPPVPCAEYVDHYNFHRPQRTLDQNPPVGRAHPPLVMAWILVDRLICQGLA
jgi:hypothetical protein